MNVIIGIFIYSVLLLLGVPLGLFAYDFWSKLFSAMM